MLSNKVFVSLEIFVRCLLLLLALLLSIIGSIMSTRFALTFRLIFKCLLICSVGLVTDAVILHELIHLKIAVDCAY